jgi:hypothetical protein
MVKMALQSHDFARKFDDAKIVFQNSLTFDFEKGPCD